MSWRPISDWLKEYGGQITTVIVILGALLTGVRYVVRSEVADIRSDVSSVKSEVSDLKSASSKTNSRVDELLKEALERAFPTLSVTAKKAELEEDFRRANSLMHLASSENIRLNSQLIDNYGRRIAQITSEPSASDKAWPAAAELISYKSFVNSSWVRPTLALPRCVDMVPSAPTVTILSPTRMTINPAVYENCQFTLDSTDEDASLNAKLEKGTPISFKHCMILYGGGQIDLVLSVHLRNVRWSAPGSNPPAAGTVNIDSNMTLTFIDCHFKFSLKGPPPQPGLSIAKILMESGGSTIAIPLATHS